MSEPALSVVVAATGAEHAMRESLDAIRAQTTGLDAEVIVATSSAECAKLATAQFPGVVTLEAEPGRLAEHLWALGIAHARGRIVALTGAACIPDENWVAETLSAHEEYHSGIGGAIEIAPGATRLDWASYLVRFARHMLPLNEAGTDLPAENVSYKRAALGGEAHWIAANGFWAQDVNAHLRVQMRSLRVNPRSVVRVKRPYSLGGILRQQMAQGRLLGRARAQRAAGWRRLTYLLATPALPLLRLRRITREVAARRRHRAQWLASLPLILLILVCEAAGELAGMTNRAP